MLEPSSLEHLIEEFSFLPGIGKKTARRLAYFILTRQKEEVSRFAERLVAAKENVKPCKHCFLYTENDICEICETRKSAKKICVVEKSSDVLTLERAGIYQGLYFVLGGVLSPLDGIGPTQLHLQVLKERIIRNQIEEIILALGSSPEAESTVLLIDKMLEGLNIRCTKLARGIPMGSDLEFVDEITMLKAFEGRISL